MYKGPTYGTVKPRSEAHMDMILFEVFLKSFDLIPQQQNYNGTIYMTDTVIVISVIVESNIYSSKTLQKGSCPYTRFYGMGDIMKLLLQSSRR